MMRKRLTGVLALLLLGGCDRIDEWLHPYDDTAPLQAIPAAPDKASIDAYPGVDGALHLEVRPGDCARAACLQFIKGRWKPLAAADARDLPLLSIDSATGSSYSADLWHAAGHGNKVLVNAGAGEQNIAAGRFDGLRIGMSVSGRQSYLTAFALSGGKTVAIDARVVTTEGSALADPAPPRPRRQHRGTVRDSRHAGDPLPAEPGHRYDAVGRAAGNRAVAGPVRVARGRPGQGRSRAPGCPGSLRGKAKT
ncbi:MAG: hypothetical protein WDN06_19015 [Asticcacaulis sp.]